MNMNEILITNKDKLEPIHMNEHPLYEYQKYVVVNKSPENNCCVSIYEIPPAKANYPFHYHLAAEEIFYIMSGNGLLETYAGTKLVKAGDIIVCPPSEKGAHKLTNASETEKLVYLDFDTIRFPELVCYPHSNKIGVFEQNKPGNFYKKDNAVKYYEGE